MEEGFFGAYLEDRINCALKTGLISRRPRGDAELLAVAAKPTIEERERLFKVERPRKPYAGGMWVKDSSGRLHAVDKKFRREYLAGRIKVDFDGFDEDEPDDRAKSEAIMRGRAEQLFLSESYNTFRWHFNWRHYVVVGVPDGITDQFVYEFKSTKILHYQMPVAEVQADLYGYFFRRRHKRLQFHDIQHGKLLTVSGPVSRSNAQRTLRDFAAIDAGERPIAPKPWKCKRCEYLSVCPVSPLRGS